MERDKHVVPDTFYPMTVNGGEFEYMISPKYDRIDYIPHLGAWIMKIYDDEEGFVTMHLEETEAFKIQEHADIPICARDKIMQSEYDSIINYRATQLEQTFGDQFDE